MFIFLPLFSSHFASFFCCSLFFFIMSSFSFKLYKLLFKWRFSLYCFFLCCFHLFLQASCCYKLFFYLILFLLFVFFKQLIKGVMFSSSPFNLVLSFIVFVFVCFKFLKQSCKCFFFGVHPSFISKSARPLFLFKGKHQKQVLKDLMLFIPSWNECLCHLWNHHF
jgi:hypothetical protein